CVVFRPLASLFFVDGAAPTRFYTLSLHDALPISRRVRRSLLRATARGGARARGVGRLAVEQCRGAGHRQCAAYRHPQARGTRGRSEEHTSELQSRENLVCRLLLEKKKKKTHNSNI